MTGVCFVNDAAHILYDTDMREIRKYLALGKEPPQFEAGG